MAARSDFTEPSAPGPRRRRPPEPHGQPPEPPRWKTISRSPRRSSPATARKTEAIVLRAALPPSDLSPPKNQRSQAWERHVNPRGLSTVARRLTFDDPRQVKSRSYSPNCSLGDASRKVKR